MATDTMLTFHDAANIFPMDDENLDALAEDIKANGQLCPIEMMDGKILDGRRRYMACRMAGVEPSFCDVSPDDPVAYVVSLNLHRRHLTTSQKAMVQAKALAIYEKAAAERMKAGKKVDPSDNCPQGKGRAKDAAGAVVGISGKAVDRATKVIKHGSKELQEAVEKGTVSVSAAAAVATQLPKKDQLKVLKQSKEKPGLKRGDLPPSKDCDVPDEVVVGSFYTCPKCGQAWPEGKAIHG